MSRPNPWRWKKNRPILIALEDQGSARYYFEGFRRVLRHQRLILIAKHIGSHPSSVIDSALREQRAYNADLEPDSEDRIDEVWVVFDTEGPDNPQRLRDARDSLIRIRDLDEVHAAVSNPCIEVWFILHFTKQVQRFPNAYAVEIETRRYLPHYRKSYDPFDDLFPFTHTAIANAESLARDQKWEERHVCGCNPRSDVYQLIARLQREEM